MNLLQIWQSSNGHCIAEIERASILPAYEICLVACFIDNNKFVFAQKRGVLVSITYFIVYSSCQQQLLTIQASKKCYLCYMQIWSETSQTCLRYKGFCDSDSYFVSCIHLSKRNSHLIASVTSGQVAVSYILMINMHTLMDEKEMRRPHAVIYLCRHVFKQVVASQ